jgi:hypothetical protein
MHVPLHRYPKISHYNNLTIDAALLATFSIISQVFIFCFFNRFIWGVSSFIPGGKGTRD